MNSEDITVITDPGVDDIVALVLLDKLAQRQDKLLIATYGNNPLSVTDENSRRFVAARGKRWQYRSGAVLPQNGVIERPWAENYHGSDGLWGVPLPPSSAVPRAAVLSNTADVISLAPLTEANRLLRSGSVKQLMIMGGAFGVEGNETRSTEFNVAMDADAAQSLFSSCKNVRVRVVPMDAAVLVRWSMQDVRKIQENSENNRWLKRLLLAWFEGYDQAQEKQFVLYDPLAVYLKFCPEAATWSRTGVAVVRDGVDRGRTVFSDANPPCDVAVTIPQPRQVSEEIFSLLFEEASNA